ncbi:MAG TPA: PQQ-binding-like beta-propeller repeat protein [Steroidobacteraceae bacterium]|nr:PQQ-binding-like beta-propeller repeat protein [Steroidobacteraceae bacterium]
MSFRHNMFATRGVLSGSRTWHACWRVLAVSGLLSALGACGGGGGGGGSSSSNPPATLQVTPTAVNVSASVTDAAPTALVQVSVQSNSSGQFYLKGQVSNNGIASASNAVSGTVENITLQFKSPSSLGTGTYVDTLTIQGCYDQACTQQVSNSPQQVSITYSVTQPQPQISSLSPASVTAGSPAFVLTVYGVNFQSNSQVLWNGSPRTTTYVSGGQLTALITVADVAAAGTANVQVATGNVQSTVAAFTINALPPLQLSQVSPTQVTAGGGPFYVTAIGSGFTASSAIAWNGASLTTTYVSSTMLRAPVTSAQIAAVGTASVTVVNPPAQGGTTPAQTLTIVAPTVDAVSYQMNPAHTGAVAFNALSLPAGSTWTVDVGGSPSYALIVAGRVFVTVNVNNNAQLLALDGATGAKLWGPIALTGNVNAAYDGGRLFVVSGSPQGQIIQALDPATGNALWSATVNGGWFPEPPVAADGIVYAINAGLVTAFNETNGATLWSQGVGGTDGIVAVTPDGVYGASPCTAVTLQPAVGSVLWSNNSGCSGGGGATPVVANGLDYAPNASAGSSGTVFDAETGALKGTYNASVIPAFTSTTGFFLSGGTLQGVALSNNQILWSFAGDGQLSSAPIVVNGYVFIGSGGGNLYALDVTTGQQVWTQSLGAAVPPTNEYGPILYTGLAAGDGWLVVPNGTRVTAYVLSTSP